MAFAVGDTHTTVCIYLNTMGRIHVRSQHSVIVRDVSGFDYDDDLERLRERVVVRSLVSTILSSVVITHVYVRLICFGSYLMTVLRRD